MPTSDRNSQAAPKPTASAMGGVPASKRAGGAAYVVTPSSRNTSPIISPPPCHGRISSNRFERPHKTPMPVGPHILWPLNATKSTPKFLDVQRLVRRALARVEQNNGLGGHLSDFFYYLLYRCDTSQNVGHVAQRDHFCLRCYQVEEFIGIELFLLVI